jgi:hypothetical protein
MNMRELASEIARREKGKSQVKVGDVREILAILSDMIVEDPNLLLLLTKNGISRVRKSNRKG